MSLVSKEVEHPEQQFQKIFIGKNHNISIVGIGYKMIGHNISILDQTWATIVSSLKFPRNTIKTLTLPTNFICLSLGHQMLPEHEWNRVLWSGCKSGN